MKLSDIKFLIITIIITITITIVIAIINMMKLPFADMQNILSLYYSISSMATFYLFHIQLLLLHTFF